MTGTPLDPAALIAATTLRYQLGDTHVVSKVLRPTSHELPTTADIATAEKDVTRASNQFGFTLIATLIFICLAITGVATDLSLTLVCAPLAAAGFWRTNVVSDAEQRRRKDRNDLIIASTGRSGLEVPSNVRDAWNRIRSVAATYADDPAAPVQITKLEAGAWVVVEEIAAHVAAGTGSGPECVALADSLFRAAAQADTYDLLRRNDNHQVETPQAASVLDAVDLTGHLAMLTPTAPTPTVMGTGSEPILTAPPLRTAVS